MSEKCKYLLPCGWCDKNDKPCTLPKEKSFTDSLTHYNKGGCTPDIHQWEFTGVSTLGSSYRCKICGTTKFEPYELHRTSPLISIGDPAESYGTATALNPSSPCDTCSNNPKNGGSGNCNCTLGTPKVTCTIEGATSRWSWYANNYNNQEKKHEG